MIISHNYCRLSFKSLLFSLALTVAAWSEEPHTPPQFRMSVEEKVLANIVKETGAEAIMNEILAEPERFPAFAWRADAVNAGGQVSALGMTQGCLLISRNNLPLEPIGSVSRQKIKLSTTPGELVWIDLKGQLHRSQVKGGLLGVQYLQYRNLVSYYVKHGQRNKAWDSIVVAALKQQEKNIAHAESLWALACKLGYKPDQLSSYCGMYQAIANGDVPKVVAFGKAIINDKSDNRFPLFDEEWQQLFSITGDPSWLEPAVTRAASGDSEASHLVDFYKFYGEFYDESKSLASPVVLAEKMKRRSFLASEDYEKTWGSSRGFFTDLQPKAVAAAKAGKPSFEVTRLGRSPDTYLNGWMGPGESAKNIDVSITFRVTPTALRAKEVCGFERVFTFGLANRTHSGDNLNVVPLSARILAMSVFYGKSEGAASRHWRSYVPCGNTVSDPYCRQGFFASATPAETNIIPPFDADQGFHTLRIVRVENQAEALLDGKRMTLTHLPEGLTDPGVFLHIVGTKLEIIGYTADILE